MCAARAAEGSLQPEAAPKRRPRAAPRKNTPMKPLPLPLVASGRNGRTAKIANDQTSAKLGSSNAQHNADLSRGDEDAMRERRGDELMALHAILPEGDLLFTPLRETDPTKGEDAGGATSGQSTTVTLTVPIVLPRPAQVKIVQRRFSKKDVSPVDVTDAEDVSQTSIPAPLYTIEEQTMFASSIVHLPPIKVLIRLPQGYPEHEPPQIIHIEGILLDAIRDKDARRTAPGPVRDAANKMAAALRGIAVQKLRAHLLQQYADIKGEVLFTWYDTLREGLWCDILDAPFDEQKLPFVGSGGVIRFDEVAICGVGSTGSARSQLLTDIRAQDVLSRRKAFEGERFGCGICLEEMRGTKCWRIDSCQHVFCQDCLSGYLSSMIREGAHRQASACPDPECVSARAKAEADHVQGSDARKVPVVGVISEEELLEIVGPQLTARLLDLQEKADAMTDPRSGYCPRPTCGQLVRGDPKDIGTVYEAMRQCACGFTYCQYCGKAWHGRAPCDHGSTRELVEAYKAACEDEEEGYEKRRAMELKYGVANLVRMVKSYEEERENRAWMEANSQACPACDIRINRSHGCAHMTCKRCNTHFCYRCGQRLDPASPYKHYNTPGLGCYMRLFEVEEVREPWLHFDELDVPDLLA